MQMKVKISSKAVYIDTNLVPLPLPRGGSQWYVLRVGDGWVGGLGWLGYVGEERMGQVYQLLCKER